MFENIPIEIDKLPKLEEVTFNKVERNYFKVIILNILLLFTILIGSIFLFFTYNKELLGFTSWIIYIILLFFGVLLFYYYINFLNRKYVLRNYDISYKKGVFYKSTTTVPFNRIQHIELDEGLFSRFFKLATLNIFTAGANGTDLSIKGLSKENAIKIKKSITKKING